MAAVTEMKQASPQEKQALLQKVQAQAHQYYVKGELDKSLLLYQQLLLENPENVLIYSNLGVVHSRIWEFEKADGFFLKALSLNPEDTTTLNNYANSLQKQERLEEAIETCDKVLAQDPNAVSTIHNKAIALRKLGRMDEALELFKRVVELAPNHADAHFCIGFCYLYKGEWEKAWPEYEWRWKMREAKGAKVLEEKLWQGEDLTDKTILLYNEQGFGDTIQMVRFAAQLKEKGAKVKLQCQENLVTLLSFAKGVSQVFKAGDDVGDYDYQCPIFSVPYRLGITPETIPYKTPYIQVGNKDVELKPREGKSFKVGLVWSTSQTNLISHNKSATVEDLKPLLELEKIQFYSLQVDDQKKDIYQAGVMEYLADMSPYIKDFSSTAQIIQNLDLVITVDTAVAHLAGALNKPVWTLLPKVADWRWGLNGAQSDWYPSMRLYRQTHTRDWSDVIQAVKKDLEKMVS